MQIVILHHENKKRTFFKESDQTTEDATINMLDLERMNDKQLTRIYNAFFN